MLLLYSQSNFTTLLLVEIERVRNFHPARDSAAPATRPHAFTQAPPCGTPTCSGRRPGRMFNFGTSRRTFQDSFRCHSVSLLAAEQQRDPNVLEFSDKIILPPSRAGVVADGGCPQ